MPRLVAALDADVLVPKLDPASLRRRAGQMRDALEDHLVEPGSLDDVPDAINPKDRHVIAAALAGEASIVVSNDKRLRAETETADLGLVAMSADDFAANLWDLMPDHVGEVISVLVEKRTKRPLTVEELMEALRGPFPAMAAAWFAAASDWRRSQPQ